MKRALHVCDTPGCYELVSGNHRYCAKHERRPPDTRPSSAQRGYDAEWQKIRAAFLQAHPFCWEGGHPHPANEVDHIVPLADGGTHDWSNLRAMCKRHHSQRTAKDQPGGFVVKERQENVQ